MIDIKTGNELEAMRISGRMAGEVREKVSKKVRPGVTTLELSEYAAELIKKLGAESAFLGYLGFPGIICASVNEEVVHGIPNKKPVKIGDIVSIDVGVRYKGYIGDTATTVMVGVTDKALVNLVKITEQALEAGVCQALEGNRVSDISYAIEKVAIGAGFSVVREFVGHGVGKNMHEEPQVPNFGKPGRGPVLKAGMTIALEPMVNFGGASVRVLDDGWTVVTRDNQPSAHFEHTILVGENAPEILTKVDG